MILLAEKDICPAEKAAQTVTYVVTGSNASNADVTYGPAGSSYQATVPMSVTRPLRNPPSDSYEVGAQLQGGGSVSCQVKVDGVTIASASAAGSYNIAHCQIGQDGTGSWENALAENADGTINSARPSAGYSVTLPPVLADAGANTVSLRIVLSATPWRRSWVSVLAGPPASIA